MKYMFTGLDRAKDSVKVQCLTVPGGRTVFFDIDEFLTVASDVDNVPDFVMDSLRKWGSGYSSDIY